MHLIDEYEICIFQVIKEYCILPLGSKVIRSGSPLIKSVLLVGPKGSGKRLLVNAVCTELGATVFDLTPANIVGKYPGKLGLIMLIHLVNKVSRYVSMFFKNVHNSYNFIFLK